MSAVPEAQAHYEVELSWRASAVYEVQAADEDAAIELAIARARDDGAEADEFDVEAVGQVGQ